MRGAREIAVPQDRRPISKKKMLRVIGATGNNGQGITGVNWVSSIMGLKFIGANGSGATSNAILAIDFAIVPTIRFDLVWVFFVLSLDRRRILHVNVTRHPTAQWTARQVVEGRLPALELFAEELRLSQHALGEITGEFTADDLLGVIFSRFCIGK